MTTFPTFAACTTCQSRWPETVLDNVGHCPLCGLDGRPTITATFVPGWYDAATCSFGCAYVWYAIADGHRHRSMYRSDLVCTLVDEAGFTWPAAEREASRLWDLAVESPTRTVTVPW